MPKRGALRKKTRTHDLKSEIDNETPTGPCSFVVKRGRVGKVVSELVSDIRQLMTPNTFSSLRESKRNSAHDYVQVAGSLGATHLMRVSCNEKEVPHLHLSRMPAGPSFDFKIEKFSLISDIRKQLKSGGIAMSRDDEQFAPVAILNGFKSSNDEFAALLCEALKGLIPPINIDKINVKTCRRVVLFNYTAETHKLSIRHYRIHLSRKTLAALPEIEGSASASPGIMLNARKSSKIPNLGGLVSISDLVAPQAIADELNDVEIIASKSSRSTSLNLIEIGPRIEATMSRVLGGVEEGTILFSKFAPETIGSAILKKKAKRVYEKAAKETKRVRNAERAGEDEDEEMNFSE